MTEPSEKPTKGRAPSVALKAMEGLQADLADRDILVDHWRQIPEAVLAAIDGLRDAVKELRENPLVSVEYDTRIDELRDGLFEIGHEPLEPHEPTIPFVISLIKEADRLIDEQERTIKNLGEQAGAASVTLLAAEEKIVDREEQIREVLANYDVLVGDNEKLRRVATEFQAELRTALGWRDEVAGSVPAAITKLRNDLSSLASQLEESRATKDMHKERYQQEILAHAETSNDLAQARGLLADANNKIELLQSDVQELDARAINLKTTVRMQQTRLDASWWRRLFKKYGE